MLYAGPGKNDSHSAAPLARPVREFEGTAVRFRDLTGKNKADTAARRFCCVERNKRVARIQQARAVVFDGQVHGFFEQLPANVTLGWNPFDGGESASCGPFVESEPSSTASAALRTRLMSICSS